MASKKCPKCGEDNPAEAVMCWACYTPLSGAPTMAVPGMTGPGMAGAGVATRGPMGSSAGSLNIPSSDDGSGKKAVDPRLIGGGAFLAVVGLIAFFMMGKGGGEDEGTLAPVVNPDGTTPITEVQPPPSSGVAALGNVGGGGAAPPAPVALPFTPVVSPSPNFATGVAGILAAQPNISSGQAAGLARYAKNQFTRNGRWTNMQICVFNNQAAADSFSSYQNKRRGAPLTTGDYQQLAALGVWANTPAFLEVRGKSERVFTPMGAPTSWWGQASR